MTDKPETTRKPIAVSSEQAEALHSLHKAINDGFSGNMSENQRLKSLEHIKFLWDGIAELRMMAGISKGMKQ